MKKRLSLFIIFLLSSFFFYFFYNQKIISSNLWDIVPSKSTIIFELEDPNTQLNKILSEISESKLKNSVNDIINDYNNFNDFIDGKIEKYFSENKVIISFFNLSNKKLVPVYFSYKKNLDDDFILKKLRDKGYDFNKRKLNGQIIFEAKNDEVSHIFSFLDNKVVYSSNSIVIEDVIRSINNSELLFKNKNKSLFSQVKIKQDYGNLYINYNDIQKILANVIPEDLFRKSLKLLPEKSFYDIEIDKGLIRMNGFSSNENTNKYLGNNSYDSILNFIPSNTILYSNRFRNSDGSKTISKGLFESYESNTFYEISIIRKPNNPIKNEKKIDENIYSFDDEKILLEAELEKSEEEFYYLNFNKYILISRSFNSLVEIKSLLIKKDFLIKNLQFNKFQKQLNQSHDILLIFDISKLLPISNSNIGYASVQLNKIQDKFYMSLNLSEKSLDNDQIKEDNTINEYSFTNNLASKPHIVFSHIDNKAEVIIQDEKNIIYHLSNSLQPIWSDSIEKIVSKIYTIDYYKNNKKQIVFASQKKIYSYDRKGNPLIGFPFDNPSKSPIKHINIIDYDNSKRYRIISSHENGEIFFYDKSGNILDGWNPLSMEDGLVQAPIHTRIRGKDYIIMVLKNGRVYVKNRKGEDYNEFPINLDSEISNKLYFKKSSSSSKSIIQILSENGKLFEISLDGKILSSKDQYRNEKDSKFKMIHEASGKNPILVSYDSYSLFKDDNKINFKNINDITFQYYNLKKNKSFLILTDGKLKKSYFLDNNLKYFINPISNQDEVSILDYSNSIIIYKTLNNNLSMMELKK